MRNLLIISLASAGLMFFSCNSEKKWNLDGNIENASKTTLFVQASDNGRWYTLDTIMTNDNGDFNYSRIAAGYPDIYRLTLGEKSIYFPIDSTETVSVTANADNFDTDYTISGSTAADMLMAVDRRIREAASEKGYAALPGDSLLKRELGGMIIGDPAGIVSYYIINKQINGRRIFNPDNRRDNKVIGAVANAFDQYRPTDPRTRYLRALYLAHRPSMRNSEALDTVHATEIGFFDIALTDNTGATHTLSDVVDRNKVVVLNFTAYLADWSPAYNLELAKAYEKYHNSGLEIYQVGLDEDEFQWKQSAKNLPWITVYNPSTTGADLLMKYNVQALPATFIITNGELAKRVTDVTAISSDIAAHL